MGDTLKKVTRPTEKLFTEGVKKPVKKAFNKAQTIDKPLRKGATAQKRAAAAEIAKQQQTEKLRVAEVESEVATRRTLAGGKAGRKSLIKSSGAGLSANLGGTTGA
jgi:hypothetical protein